MFLILHLHLQPEQSSLVAGRQERLTSKLSCKLRSVWLTLIIALAIIKGLSDANLHIIGSDIVQSIPIYDNAAETTGIAVGQVSVFR
jgi:hypothetical protein